MKTTGFPLLWPIAVYNGSGRGTMQSAVEASAGGVVFDWYGLGWAGQGRLARCAGTKVVERAVVSVGGMGQAWEGKYIERAKGLLAGGD